MITKLALYLPEIIFYSCDEFSAGEFSASCFSTSFPPSIFDELFSASCFRLVVFDELFSTSFPRFGFYILSQGTQILLQTLLHALMLPIFHETSLLWNKMSNVLHGTPEIAFWICLKLFSAYFHSTNSRTKTSIQVYAGNSSRGAMQKENHIITINKQKISMNIMHTTFG